MTALLPVLSFAAGLGLGLILWNLTTRRQIDAQRRRLAELAELQRHQALPPSVPLPDRLSYHGQILCRARPIIIGRMWRCWN